MDAAVVLWGAVRTGPVEPPGLEEMMSSDPLDDAGSGAGRPERDPAGRRPALRLARVLGTAVAVVPILMGLRDADRADLAGSLGLHLVLALPLLLALGFAWRRPRWGAVTYGLLGAVYAGTLLFRQGVGPFLAVAAPLFVISGLLWWSTPRGGASAHPVSTR
jgi:hypothetical protein